MLQGNTFQKVASENINAMKDLKPKFNVWTTSSKDGGNIKDLLQALPPLLSTIEDQTGIQPPSWMAKMPSKGDWKNNQHAVQS